MEPAKDVLKAEAVEAVVTSDSLERERRSPCAANESRLCDSFGKC